MKDTLGRDDIIELLTELGEVLEQEGERAELFIVGGAAMALAYNTRRFTQDLDALFEPKTVVYEAARKVAERNNLNADWLNDAVKGFLPGADPNATVMLKRPGIVVRVASPRYLFAMKAAAARAERDANDLRELYRLNGFHSVEEALDCVADYYPSRQLTPKTEYLLRELLS
jgi:predicted nucleotidyltransferase